MIRYPLNFTQKLDDLDFAKVLTIGFQQLKDKSRQNFEIDQIPNDDEVQLLLTDSRFAPTERHGYTANHQLTPNFFKRFDFDENTRLQVIWRLKVFGGQLGFFPILQSETAKKDGFRVLRFYCEYKKKKYQVQTVEDQNYLDILEGGCPFKVLYRCKVNAEKRDISKYSLNGFDPYHNHDFGAPI
ncbi:UNKNOWN [Stylonychia lemnae]|uniref:Uncharacterized protein n=1 Tax=Stylonychia lemnae TaxID=5949 RepID=A0A078AGT2_STYLE|nr:UNKNOWN [Stylonychia lemnae]|eukprot:CDW81051.1 UNKNOWN [Stylonychia lemnae]